MVLKHLGWIISLSLHSTDMTSTCGSPYCFPVPLSLSPMRVGFSPLINPPGQWPFHWQALGMGYSDHHHFPKVAGGAGYIISHHGRRAHCVLAQARMSSHSSPVRWMLWPLSYRGGHRFPEVGWVSKACAFPPVQPLLFHERRTPHSIPEEKPVSFTCPWWLCNKKPVSISNSVFLSSSSPPVKWHDSNYTSKGVLITTYAY